MLAPQMLVRRRTLDRDPTDRADGVVERARVHSYPPSRARHPADGFLHQRSTEIVRSAAKDDLRRFDAELDPRHLHVVDNSVEHDPRDGVHPTVLDEGRTGTGLSREIDRRVLMNERERNELRESTRFALDPGKTADVENPMRRRIDVPVHDRRRAANPERVRRSHDLLPRVGGELPLRQEPPDLVIEDLGGGTGDRSEPVRRALPKELLERDSEPRCPVEHLHRTERVDVDVGGCPLHRVQQVEVELAGQVRMDPALHADLRCAPLNGLAYASRYLLERERVALRIDLSLRERAEPASHVAHVREVDVAVYDVGDLVTDRLSPEVVGDGAERLERSAFGTEQRERVAVVDGLVTRGLAQRGADLQVESLGRDALLVPRARHGQRFEVAVDLVRVGAKTG